MKTEEKLCFKTVPLRVIVIGYSGVGKSALAVRYLTRRYIGEYRSDTDMLYKCVLNIETCQHPVEIMDTVGSSEEDIRNRHIDWAEAYLIVYSITDKKSFLWATQTLKLLSSRRPSACVCIVAAKSDLSHARQVDEIDGRTLALSHAARFHELSSAESDSEVVASLNAFLKEAKNSRPFGGSPKQRKISVSRMLGSLIGRNSPPPSSQIAELIVLDKNEVKRLKEPIRHL